MERIQAAGLIYGRQMHHLDHIAPLAIMMGVPLIVTEPQLEELSAKYYPNLEVLCFDYPEVGEKIVQNCDVIFSSLPRALFDEIVFIAEQLRGKRVLNLWCPHGNSDKGHASYFMEGLKGEEIALVYGQQMIDFLTEKGVYSELRAAVTVGNYRYQYYQSCAPFYDQLVQNEVASKLIKGNRTILYAPTWDDAEGSSSFDAVIDTLIDCVPKWWNLIVKPHPNTLETMENQDLFTEKENVLLLKEFKGLGPYTIGAILSFAFKQKAPAVDGNVLRVLSRYFCIEESIDKGKTQREIKGLTEALLPDQEPWIVMEALIELGALVCQKKPQCTLCPLRENCAAYRECKTALLPKKNQRAELTILHRVVAIVDTGSEILMRKGEKGKVMAGLWEFPYFDREVDIEKTLGLSLQKVEKLPEVTHGFTRYKAFLYPTIYQAKRSNIKNFSWIPYSQVGQKTLSSGHRRILQLLKSNELLPIRGYDTI